MSSDAVSILQIDEIKSTSTPSSICIDENQLYVIACDDLTWEDIVIYKSSEDAIKASIKKPNTRIEIFVNENGKYIPSYSYYKNGKLIIPNN